MKKIAALFLSTLLLFTACRTLNPESAALSADAPQICFLLTFDDGPSIREPYNPTLAILDQLETNPIQPGIKALFFVQTEHPQGGGTPRGRDILREIHEKGHVIGIHSVSAKGHISHTSQPTGELIYEIQQAKDVIQKTTGAAPLFVRPPFGACDIRTRTVYHQLGLNMLMANVRTKDGVISGYNRSFRRRSNIYNALRNIRKNTAPEPVTYAVVNFHDTNPYTARHMTEYLHILIQEARHAGFAVPENPFCGSREQVVSAAEATRVPPPAGNPQVQL
ncbi:MAG: polysaccharide deacetylase family protein [Pontiellaceae bacterium]|jgi:peptidoglycan/xylan/chitin deacetylase (PgdA/CDA1 family)|nr:polysaccharide deacetylase family protein [Pontiellaceae bacterium]